MLIFWVELVIMPQVGKQEIGSLVDFQTGAENETKQQHRTANPCKNLARLARRIAC
jgi:hypothetical protein